MERKVNKVGKNTLTISLPAKWVKTNKIDKGDTLNLTEKGSDLFITTTPKAKLKRITLDISSYKVMVGRVIGALYKAGYDEIRINYETKETLDLIQKELGKGFIGFDMVHVDHKYCIIKSMAITSKEELDLSTRRMFRLLIDNAEEGYELVKQKKFEELDSIIARDLNVNKFADFSRRLMNKFEMNSSNKNLKYFLVEESESIGDEFRDLLKLIKTENKSLEKETLNLFKQIIEYFKQLYELIYSFKEKDFELFGKNFKELNKKISNALSKTNKDTRKLERLRSILVRTFDLNGPLITLQIFESGPTS